MSELIRSRTEHGVATLTLASVANRNALSKQLVSELHQATREAVAAAPRAIVIDHDGPVFCAGADLTEMLDTGGKATDPAPLIEIMRLLSESDAPTIAVVRGAVRAGGIGLMAACDLVVADESINFALTEVRIGVAPAVISVPILARTQRSKIAAAMLTGEPFTADEARQMGLVTHAVTTAALDETVAALLDGIRAGAPKAVAATKQLLREVPQLDTTEAYKRMAELSSALFQADEAAEGIAAFKQKRRPRWPAS